MALHDNETACRYELQVQGQTVWADYRREGDRLVITHVEAPPALRGTGAAGQLMAALVETARAQHETLVPLCGYAASWLRRHTGQTDIVADRDLGGRG